MRERERSRRMDRWWDTYLYIAVRERTRSFGLSLLGYYSASSDRSIVFLFSNDRCVDQRVFEVRLATLCFSKSPAICRSFVKIPWICLRFCTSIRSCCNGYDLTLRREAFWFSHERSHGMSMHESRTFARTMSATTGRIFPFPSCSRKKWLSKSENDRGNRRRGSLDM